MNEPIFVMAPDGLLEFRESEVQSVSYIDQGVQILLKTGEAFLLVGHEAAHFLETAAARLIRSLSGDDADAS